MSDPLSITASIIGIVGPALHGIRILIGDIKDIKNAPDVLKNLLTDLQVVEKALESIREIDEEQWKILSKATADLAITTIEKTSKTCDEFKENLKKWINRSADGKISLWDKGTLGFWKKGDLEDMSKQLQTCQDTLISLTSTATLHSSIKNAKSTKEMATMVSISQGQINSSLAAVDQRLDEIGQHLREQRPIDVFLERETKIPSGQVSREREELEAARQLFEGLLAQVQKVAEETKKNKVGERESYTISFGNNNKGMQLGVNEGTISGFRFGGA